MRETFPARNHVKLQEVFASEQNSIGNWDAIGYKDPSGGTGSTSGATTNFDYINDAAGNAHWKAAAKVGLNDCQTGTVWSITSAYSSSTGNVTASAGFDNKSVAACTVVGLTPNFCKIGNTTGTGGCAGTTGSTSGNGD